MVILDTETHNTYEQYRDYGHKTFYGFDACVFNSSV